MKISLVEWHRVNNNWEFKSMDFTEERQDLDGIWININSRNLISGYVETSKVEEAKLILLDQTILRVQNDIADLAQFVSELQKVKIGLNSL